MQIIFYLWHLHLHLSVPNNALMFPWLKKHCVLNSLLVTAYMMFSKPTLAQDTRRGPAHRLRCDSSSASRPSQLRYTLRNHCLDAVQVNFPWHSPENIYRIFSVKWYPVTSVLSGQFWLPAVQRIIALFVFSASSLENSLIDNLQEEGWIIYSVGMGGGS